MDHIILTSTPDDALAARWHAFLDDAPFATHYTTPDFFVDPFAGKGEKFAVLACEGDRVDAVMTGLKVGNRVISGMAVRPQTAFRNGADRKKAAEALVSGLAAYAGKDVDLISFFSWEPIEGLDELGYSHETSTGADQIVMLDLAKGKDQLFKEFSERRRTDLRKVMKQGLLEVRILETEAELTELYEIHKTWNAGKGNTPDPFESFKAVLDSKNRAIFIALSEGRIVAGTYIRSCSGGVVEYAANNSLGETQKLRPNELLGWRAIEWACDNGFKKFSMGASHTFLARYGGELVSTHRYRCDRSFLRLHVRREQVERLAARTYLSLPESLRKRIKSVTARV